MNSNKSNHYLKRILTSIEKNKKVFSFTNSHVRFINYKDNLAFILIQSYFFTIQKDMLYLICSDPIYSHTNNKVTIQMFYYNNEKHNKKDESKKIVSEFTLIPLSNNITSIYNKEVSLVFTRIHYPYINSSIFAKYLAHNAPTNTFVHFQDSIITYVSRNASELPSYISGIKIELAGRLLTERVVPRITTKAIQFGSFFSQVDYAKYTTKNELGTFTIKV
jgi:hypothetical protein